MYVFLNVRPDGKFVGDCVKRASCVAFNMPYKEVTRELNRYKKVTGAKTFNDTNNCEPYVEKVLNGKLMKFPATKGEARMNGERFCKAYPKGRYILRMAGHWSACVNGVILDTWDCSEKCVYKAWRCD